MSGNIGATAMVTLSMSLLILIMVFDWVVNKRRKEQSNFWLMTIACLGIIQSIEFMYHEFDWYINHPFWLKVCDPLVILLPFCLYGYIRSLQGIAVITGKLSSLMHFMPALIILVLAIPYWVLPAQERIEWMRIGLVDQTQWQPVALFGNPYSALFASLGLFYWARVNATGTLTSRTDLKAWIRRIQTVQFSSSVLLIVMITASLIINGNISASLISAPIGCYLVFVFLSHSKVPYPQLQKAAIDIKEQDNSNSTYTTETPTQHSETLLTLYNYMQSVLEQGVFREHDLSMKRIAQLCETTPHLASAAINTCHGGNFYDWVNSQRILAAKAALIESDQKIIDICYGVGFNSKSTFNTAFKKLTGCTPSEYRRRKTYTKQPLYK